MTGKQRLQILLDGGVPDQPPTWELVFQIPREFFGMDPAPVRSATYATKADRNRAIWAFDAAVSCRLVEELGWAAVRGGYDADELRTIKRAIGEAALVAGYEGEGVFWMPTGGNIMDFVVKLYERPDELHAEARAKCGRAKELLKQLADAGADFFVGTYDFGFNDQPFISPAHFGQFVQPYLAEIVQAAHDLGRRIILHSDGCLTQILPQIHATGIDGYQSVDPQGHMDIQAVRRDWPDWLLMGNVECGMLQDTDERRIRQSVQYCMKHGGIGRRYIFSTSNCIFAGMPPESYRVMLDEYRRCLKADC